MQTLMRRRGTPGENEGHRRSIFGMESMLSTPVPAGRASEQLNRPEVPLDGLRLDMQQAAKSPDENEDEGATTPPIQDANPRTRRFSMLRFRHASDPQLSTRARSQAQSRAESPPLMPRAPEIITTAPTMDFSVGKPLPKKKSRVRMLTKKRTAEDLGALAGRESTQMGVDGSADRPKVSFSAPRQPERSVPPAYGDDEQSIRALPINRLSESERSDLSAQERGIYGTTTTTTQTIQTTTTFFRLPRRKKTGPMFELGHLPRRNEPGTPPLSLQVPQDNASGSSIPQDDSRDRALGSVSGSSVLQSPTARSPAKSVGALGAPHLGSQLMRHGSNASSAKSSPTRRRLGLRDRSSTLTSLNHPSEDTLPTPTLASTRTSTSTGRKSFGDLFGLTSRMRHSSEPQTGNTGPGTPRSADSKNNSLSLPRAPVVLPERLEDDTPANYLKRLEEAVSRGAVATVLCKSNDQWSQSVLRSYMRGFSFFGDPMDIAIRKLLMEVELPKETQHIDRCLQGFANRYYECNPGIYATPDQAYFIAFSLLILHTDVFNKNNKHKMQKHDYVKNTKGEGVSNDILECFYDNITYTPFIHVEDDFDINGERIIQHKSRKKTIFPRPSTDSLKRPAKEPMDPYTLILDNKIQTLRPEFRNSMHLEEHYTYIGTASTLNLQDLQRTFFRTGVLQIVSARSRPDAFMSEKTLSNPQDAHVGIVDIKITKVGLLWRKDVKKKKTRSPWQEWGAILTGAQLYFFRNTAWVKSLLHQFETHKKDGHEGSPVIFKPPLESFKPDALMSTDDAVALLDYEYKKHKHAFVFVRHGGFEETFLADNEDEMNDWLAKLNYAAAFRTSGVRMRGVVGGNYDGQKQRGIRRLDGGSDSTKSIATSSGEVTISRGKIDTKMAQDILAARREIMLQKIEEYEQKIATSQSQLDAQLRNARHLQILTPIQPKTRDQILLAAGRMAAQLKWGRMELWRLRCHKEILVMDLKEEETEGSGVIRQSTLDVGGCADRGSLGRLQSSNSSLGAQVTPRSPPLSISTRPSTSKHHKGEVDKTSNDGDTPTRQQPSSFHKAQASWELPPLNFESDATNLRQASLANLLPPSPTSIRRRASAKDQSSLMRPDSSPQPDAAEHIVLQAAGFIPDKDTTPLAKHTYARSEHDESRDKVDDKDKSKIRRSLHRTLREAQAHTPTHHRSRKGRDSTSSAATIKDDGKQSTDDILSRGTGSFVVHGKKASVIHFGSELSHMTAEESRRLRDHSRQGEEDLQASPTIAEDFHSVLAEPCVFHESHGSGASGSTATARSFRQLHQRLSVAAPVDDGSSEAVSFSDDNSRLPRVESEDEDGSRERQAVFYTPDMSPVDQTGGSEDGRGLSAGKRSRRGSSVSALRDGL